MEHALPRTLACWLPVVLVCAGCQSRPPSDQKKSRIAGTSSAQTKKLLDKIQELAVQVCCCDSLLCTNVAYGRLASLEDAWAGASKNSAAVILWEDAVDRIVSCRTSEDHRLALRPSECPGGSSAQWKPEKRRLDEGRAEREVEVEKRCPDSKWQYGEDADAMGRGHVRFAHVRSTNTFEFDFPYDGFQRATLTIRDHPKYGRDVILGIVRGQFVCGVISCRLDVQFGDGEPKRYRATEPSDYSSTALFIRRASRFVKQLKKVDRVRVEARFFREGTRVLEFDVQGLEWEWE